MAKIGYFVVCEAVFGSGNEMIIKNPYEAITPLSIPGNYSFAMAFSLLNLTKNRKYILNFKIVDPNGKEISNHKIDFDFMPPEEIEDSISSGSMTVNFNNVEFYVQGPHKFIISVNDDSTKEIEIMVFPKKVNL